MRSIFIQSIVRVVAVLSCGLFINTGYAQSTKETETASLLNQLPGLEGWRTFAKPLALGTGSLLLFQRDGGEAVVWRINWKAHKISSFSLPELTLYKGKDEIRYTALASQDGLWLLGETSLLIRPNGQRLTLETKFNEPVAVVLNDQSVLVLGPSLHGIGQGDQYRLQQLRLVMASNQLHLIDRGLLSYDGKPNQNGQNYRVPRYGHSAVKLRDGRVLMLGGDTTATLASLIEPRAEDGVWAIKPVSAMPNKRVFGAALVLPDGRVAVTGPPHLRCYGDASKTRSVNVYDVQNDRWASLPPLPFVPCADAYGGDAPSLTVTPNGSLIVGAHLEPQVMVLPRDAKFLTGYASSWQVYGRMPLRRISGVVQALSDQEVVVAGGVDNQSGSFGGCCYATAGFDLVTISQNESTESLAMSFIGAGVAKRGEWVFAACGRRFGFTSAGQMRYSAYAELINLSTGKVRQLPNVPFASGAAHAFWLDDDRVLLKGVKESNSRGFDLNENLSSYLPPSSGAMAIFNVKDKRWSEPIAMPELERAQLIAVENNKALLLSDAQQVLRLDLSTHKLERVQQIQRGRQGGIARLLSKDQLVLAGGEVQSETVSVFDPECEVTSGKDCPERFAGFGPYAPLALVETLSIGDGKRKTDSTLSATGPRNLISSVITAQGRVIVLTYHSENGQASVERSSVSGKSWDKLPLPSGLLQKQGDGCESCTLILAPDPRNLSKDLIFFRKGAIATDYLDSELEKQSMHVWWWNEADQSWRSVLQSTGLNARTSPLALGAPLSPKNGKRMMSMGWHLREPALWIEP